MNGMLYIVGTPIGNLEDMSLRAIRILKEAVFIAAEDTRHTKKLLTHFDIHTKMISYHKFNERERAGEIIKYIQEGMDIALVSDAGMPGISDSGGILIKEAITNNIRVIPVPGPTASILALVSSGLPADHFVFEGFLPNKKTLRMKRLYFLKGEIRTIVFYESGNRLLDMLKDIKSIFGNRHVSVAKELTKKFEEIIREKIDTVITGLPQKDLRGEFTVVVQGAEENISVPAESLREKIEDIKRQLAVTSKEAIKLVSAQYNIPKRKVYGEWIKHTAE